ncbi:MAG TPA: calcium/sodium antiporter [Candidatus Nanoarchaeia archaeon]|nr:calcium/sodium antiporter [Candidatus Nanoarchaeia archaeon]
MIEILLLVIGIFLLIKGASYLVDGASALAKKFGVPTLVIGLTIVALGTSMPEFIVNVLAAINGSTEIAFGNIIGSNIANILLILGLTAAITPIKVQKSTVWKEIPFALLAVIVLIVVSNYHSIDNIELNVLTRVAGIIMILFSIIFFYYSVEIGRKGKEELENEKVDIHTHSGHVITLMIVGGLVALYFGGKWVVDGAIFIAKAFGLSEFLISATIIAVGTSLPELVTSFIAAKRKDPDIVVGNIVGSNILNILVILGVTAVISPVIIPSFINADMFVMLGATLLLFAALFVGNKHEIKRWQGFVFLAIYIAYVVFIIMRG